MPTCRVFFHIRRYACITSVLFYHNLKLLSKYDAGFMINVLVHMNAKAFKSNLINRCFIWDTHRVNSQIISINKKEEASDGGHVNRGIWCHKQQTILLPHVNQFSFQSSRRRRRRRFSIIFSHMTLLLVISTTNVAISNAFIAVRFPLVWHFRETSRVHPKHLPSEPVTATPKHASQSNHLQ